jgi:hypothetical protein
MQPTRLPLQRKILKIFFASDEATQKTFLSGDGQAERVPRQTKFSLLLPSKHERNYLSQCFAELS